MRIPFRDLGDESEDERIRQIGERTMAKGANKVSFITDDEPGKVTRYIAKLTEQFPGIRVLTVTDGPVPDTILVVVGPPKGAA